MNTAVACARLGAPTAFLGAVSTDEHGDAIWAHLEASGVDLRLTQRRDEATCRAEVIGDPPTFTSTAMAPPTGSSRCPIRACSGWAAPAHGGTLGIFREPGASVLVESPRRSTASCRSIRTSGPRSSNRSAVGTGIRGSTAGSPPARCSGAPTTTSPGSGRIVIRRLRRRTARPGCRSRAGDLEFFGHHDHCRGLGDRRGRSCPGGRHRRRRRLVLWRRPRPTLGAWHPHARRAATVALAEWRDIVAFAVNVAGITVQRVGADPPRRDEL